MSYQNISDAWRQRVEKEDRSLVRFHHQFQKHKSEQELAGKSTRKLVAYERKALPHLLADNLSDTSSVISSKSSASSVPHSQSVTRHGNGTPLIMSQKGSPVSSVASTRASSPKSQRNSSLQEAALMNKIQNLEKTLLEERQGRLEVQKELESLKDLLSTHLRSVKSYK